MSLAGSSHERASRGNGPKVRVTLLRSVQSLGNLEIEEAEMPVNTLYLAVLPLVHIGSVPFQSFGQTEQVLTLFPEKSFATEFYPDEVGGYVATFKNRAERFLTGGHVLQYEFKELPTDDGRVIVEVVQHVAE